jgi:hypothetical protein
VISNFTVHGDGTTQPVTVGTRIAFISLNVTEYATVRILVAVPGSTLSATYTFVARGEISDPRLTEPILARDIDVNIIVP